MQCPGTQDDPIIRRPRRTVEILGLQVSCRRSVVTASIFFSQRLTINFISSRALLHPLSHLSANRVDFQFVEKGYRFMHPLGIEITVFKPTKMLVPGDLKSLRDLASAHWVSLFASFFGIALSRTILDHSLGDRNWFFVLCLWLLFARWSRCVPSRNSGG